MADELNPFTAYESPPVAEEFPRDVPRGKDPLRVSCILAAILGGGGLLTALLAILGLLFGQQVQTVFAPPGGAAPNEIMEVQQRLQTEINSIQDRFFVLNLALTVVHVIIASSLLAGGVQCLQRMPRGPRLLLAACSAAAVYEIVRGIVQVPMQLQIMSATDFYLELMFDSAGNMPAEALRLSMLFTRIVMYAGLVLGFAWVLGKILFYVYTVRQLRKPEVRAALRTPTSL